MTVQGTAEAEDVGSGAFQDKGQKTRDTLNHKSLKRDKSQLFACTHFIYIYISIITYIYIYIL